MILNIYILNILIYQQFVIYFNMSDLREDAFKWWSEIDDKTQDVASITYYYLRNQKNKSIKDLTDNDIINIYREWILDEDAI